MNRTYQNRFLTVGTGLLIILALYGIVGTLESTETRDRWRHCVFLNMDGATTDMELETVSGNCARQVGYERTGEERP